MDLDLGAVRAFVAVADEGQFGYAADVLGITQQAVSKRIAKLETQLGAVLFERGRGGSTVPTASGARLLPHARILLAASHAAVRAVREEVRPLRVAVLGKRMAATELMDFYLAQHPHIGTEIVISNTITTSRDALRDGHVDAAFARAHGGPVPLGPDIISAPAYLEPLHLLVGKNHPFAGRTSVTLREAAGYPAWVPGAAVPSEWADFYRDLAAYSGIRIDTGGPLVGLAEIVERIADSPSSMTFTGDGARTPWHPHIRRVTILDPTPAYPLALLWSARNPHPQLPHLVEHVAQNYNRDTAGQSWIPDADRPLFMS
ncbi:LysR family transcriptional regulator [Nocardia amikacinitolerans]|uniref:LysR family transcriptional regulator n=1 Tax=Nocardia amikacinitolerans TaxID=756689 RepID=UPI0020A26BD3|nr:LysR family transcriptional regulator [Nocardia amikacinitolerans]MCP2288094.1 DNA-binding transcriptional regulator, LysR family [Nocardia amikacinitolerans]